MFRIIIALFIGASAYVGWTAADHAHDAIDRTLTNIETRILNPR